MHISNARQRTAERGKGKGKGRILDIAPQVDIRYDTIR